MLRQRNVREEHAIREWGGFLSKGRAQSTFHETVRDAAGEAPLGSLDLIL